jgi:excinuclease UvrABC ATPase subunit
MIIIYQLKYFEGTRAAAAVARSPAEAAPGSKAVTYVCISNQLRDLLVLTQKIRHNQRNTRKFSLLARLL